MVDPKSGATLKVLVFGASLRADSLNQKLAALAARVAEQNGATVEHASMRQFDVPSFDGDAETAQGIPTGAQDLRRRLQECDAFIVSSPEYNGSMPGTIKNLIDWTSRFRPHKNIEAFLSLAEAAKHYPCIKRAWVEFLGEPPDSEADRVDPIPA